MNLCSILWAPHIPFYFYVRVHVYVPMRVHVRVHVRERFFA